MRYGYVYDLETLSNCFTGVFYNVQTKEIKSYVIHKDKDDRKEFFEFLDECIKNNNAFLGYNNLFFDGPIITFIIEKRAMLNSVQASSAASLIYNEAQTLIENQDSDNNYKSSSTCPIKQIDVYKIMHYDRRKISLKRLQGSMRWFQMQDMPIHHSSKINKEDLKNILEYNVNDVLSTYEFYNTIKAEINLRKIVSKKYNFDATNLSSTKIGENLFLNTLTKATKKTEKELKEKVKRNQKIIVKDIIFDYINLTEKPFNAIKKYLDTQSVVNLKGFFTDIPLSKDTKIIEPYINKSKDYYNPKTKVLKKLNIVHYDNTFVIGSGGLHSTHNTKTVFKGGNGRLLVDLDFASYYPNLCIANDWYPEHLGEVFVEVYKKLYDERLVYKKIAKQDKSNIEANIIQLALKLALNSVYGKLGSEFSPLHDSKTQLGICVNGELTLMQCIEIVMKRSAAKNYTCELLFSNTDGFMIDIDENFFEELKTIVVELSDLTGIELEYEVCKTMYQRDVNNFILIKNDDSVKLKGSYEIDKDFHKNPSMRVVSIAVANYFINNIKPEKTIYNHLKRNVLDKYENEYYNIYYSKKHNIKVVNYGLYDFMILKKIDNRFKFYQVSKRNEKIELQKSIRYIMTTDGFKLIKKKLSNDSVSLLEATKASYEQVFNTMPKSDNKKEIINLENSIPINYNFYIKEAYKLIHSIEGYGQQLLF